MDQGKVLPISGDEAMKASGIRMPMIRAMVWKLAERSGRAASELLVQIVLARLLAPEQFGAFAIMLVFVNVGNVLVQSGLNSALVQADRTDDTDASTVFWWSVMVAMVLYLLGYIAAPIVSDWYSSYSIVWPLRVILLVLLIGAYSSVETSMLQRRLDFRTVSLVSLMSVALSGIVGVSLALLGAGLWALVGQQLSFHVAYCVGLFVVTRWIPRLQLSKDRASILLSYGWKLSVSALLDQGYQSVSDIVIGKKFSTGTLGIVSQGKRYPLALGSLLDGAIQPVMLSAAARLQADHQEVRRLVRRALITSTFLVFPVMTLFGVTAKPLILLLLGEQWAGSVPYLQMYCFIYALLPVHSTNLQAINALGRSDVFLKLELLKKAYGVVLLLLAVTLFHNALAVVASYVITGILGTIVNSFPNRSLLQYSYGQQLRDTVPAVLFSALAGGSATIAMMFGSGTGMEIILAWGVGILVYIWAGWATKAEGFKFLSSVLTEVLFKGREKESN